MDFGEAIGVIGGVERKLHYFTLALPHSDAIFLKAYPAETTEAFCDGHNAAFAFFGGVPLSMLYDNTTLAVAKICGDGKRERTRAFAELQSHYLFEDKFGRPAKGNDKGHVEGAVGYGRRNFMVPAPRFESFDALNTWLEEQCLERQDDLVRGHSETIGERLMRDLDALMALPPTPYDACEKVSTRATSISMVRYRNNDYSVPVAFAHHEVQVRGYVHEVVIGCGSDVIARHKRSYDKADMIFDPLHFLPLLERKVGALDQAAPLQGWDLPDAFATLHRLLRRGWADPASASTSRSCGCWRASRWSMSMAPFGRRWISARSAMTRSSTWCCAGSSAARPSWTWTSTRSCQRRRSRRQSQPTTCA